MKTYIEVKEEHEKAYNLALENHQVFWAFSNEQFKEGIKKINLAEGEKVVDIGMGGFCPKKNIERLMTELKTLDNQKKQALKELQEEKERGILYELNNHECYYTGDPTPVIEIFKGTYKKQEILAVFKKYGN